MLDIDVKDPKAAAAVEEWVQLWFDDRDGSNKEIPTRVGKAPKRALFFRTDTPFSKSAKKFKDRLGEEHKLEFLCDGQQVIVHGIHPDTKQPYQFSNGRSLLDVPRSQLPAISRDEAERLFDDCVQILVNQFGFIEAEDSPKTNGARREHNSGRGPVDVEAELAAMTPDNVNDVHCRVIPSLLWQAVHPDDVVTQVVSATMTMAASNGLTDWSEEREARNYVAPRVRSALKNLFMEKYDSSTGEIPVWLCGEFHQDWAAALAAGKEPNIGFNGKFFVRAYDRSNKPGPKINGGGEAPSIVPDAPATALTRPRFPLIDFGELVPTDDEPYLVEELIPRHGLGLFWGKMKSLKSTLVLDLSLHVSRGRPFRGLKVQQGRVVYCVFEGSHGYRNRIEALRRHYGIPPDETVPLHLMAASINLIKEHDLLIAEIRAQLAAKGVTDMPILIVLDTLNRSLTGSESADEDMARYIKAADKLREAFGAFVIIVHHCGHDESRPRGHSSLSGAIDAQIKIERPERGPRVTAEVELMRDGPEGKVIHSIVKAVEVHVMLDGKRKTSPVLVPDDHAERAERLPAKLQNTTGAVFSRSLTESLAQYGQVFQPDAGAMTVNAVDQEQVRARFYELYNDGSAKPDAKKHAFSRALRDAQKAGYVDSRTKSAVTMIWVSYNRDAEESEQ